MPLLHEHKYDGGLSLEWHHMNIAQQHCLASRRPIADGCCWASIQKACGQQQILQSAGTQMFRHMQVQSAISTV